MSRAKQASKRKGRRIALPALGLAGLSLSLAGGASASTSRPATDQPQTTSPHHEILLGEEEISDVTLSTFYVFDKENAKPQLGEKLAWWGGCSQARCRCGCRCGCGFFRGCGCRCGCGGCGCFFRCRCGCGCG
jgi:hypothetical protein